MSVVVESCARLFVCFVGVLLSVYAYHVETTKLHDVDYEAMCDLGGSISCSAVFTSAYGKGFGLVRHILDEDHILNQPNSVFGLIFFITQMSGAFWNDFLVSNILYWMTALGIVACFYLAYILAFILHDFCVVCVATYSLTFILHYLNYRSRSRCAVLKNKKEA